MRTLKNLFKARKKISVNDFANELTYSSTLIIPGEEFMTRYPPSQSYAFLVLFAIRIVVFEQVISQSLSKKWVKKLVVSQSIEKMIENFFEIFDQKYKLQYTRKELAFKLIEFIELIGLTVEKNVSDSIYGMSLGKECSRLISDNGKSYDLSEIYMFSAFYVSAINNLGGLINEISDEYTVISN